MSRLPVRKTYKLFIGGEFPRSESGRTYEAEGQNVSRASRKDVRDAVRAARGAFGKWSAMTAYNRGQVLYRIAEMMEARRTEFADFCSGPKEVERSIDRVVWYAGWADKLAQVLGSSNPVAGPYFNFTVPEPTGVVGILAPPEPALLGLVSRVAPAIVGGNSVVVVASFRLLPERHHDWLEVWEQLGQVAGETTSRLDDRKEALRSQVETPQNPRHIQNDFPNQPVISIGSEHRVHREHIIDVSCSANTHQTDFRFVHA